MPKLNPVAERLRDACVQAADGLILAGRASTIRQAALMVWSRSRQRHQPTGFSATTPERFVRQFADWYRRNAAHRHTRTSDDGVTCWEST
jgi:hypothetical protein